MSYFSLDGLFRPSLQGRASPRRLTFPLLVTFLLLLISSLNIFESEKVIHQVNNGTVYFGAPVVTEGLSPTVDLPWEELLARQIWTLRAQDNFLHLDVGVPVKGQDDKLVTFAKVFGEAIEQFRSKVESSHQVSFRLLVTRHPREDNSSSNFQQRLATAAKVEEVVFVPLENVDFQRAKSINLLHSQTRHDSNSVLVVVDVDMVIGPRFLYNALTKVGSKSIYFPMAFSEFRPSTVMLVEQFLGRQSRYSEHRGLWRGYDVYALPGKVAKSFLMDVSIEGAGQENLEFFHRAKKKYHIIRSNEYDLIHPWHPKYCEKSALKNSTNDMEVCVKARSAMEGSTFGALLLEKVDAAPETLQTMFQSMTGKEVLDLEAYKAKAFTEYGSWKALPGDESTVVGKAKGILIGVTTSRANFGTRIVEIMKTWAKRLPDGIFVRFYVGDPVAPSNIQSGSADDIARLATEAGITDLRTIVVMNGIQDNEYPLVHKAAAVLKYMEREASELIEKSRNEKIVWFADVDDDTYINVDALQEFLFKQNHEELVYVGQRGYGGGKDKELFWNAGLRAGYCMGGTGIMMSQKTVRILNDKMEECIAHTGKKLKILYDDLLFGICLQRHAGIGCWDASNYYWNTFSHNYEEDPDFPYVGELWKAVSFHPHKTPGMMIRTHERFQNHKAWSLVH